MATALLTHHAGLEHRTPEGHPERVARLRAVSAALEAPEFQHLLRIEAPEIDDAAILRAHTPRHLERLKALEAADDAVAIDADTWFGPGSMAAARRAAGAAAEAARLVVADEAANALCAMRPPGHHAESDRAMGFCLLNSAAIAALTAIEELGMARVAIVDFDVHHGNGTQEIFERDPRVFYASSHEWPLYPGTGAKHETGVGNIVNAHLPAFSGSSAFRAAYETEILPALSAFAPELVIASAGFDAHQADPLANIGLTEDDFAWVTERLCEAARESAGGRLVSVLEGGYALEALAASAAAHVRVLTRHSGR